MSACSEPSPADEHEASPQILVVEDDFVVRFSIVTELREMGGLVVEAPNADEAWKYLSAGYPVDLVFTDHKMPGSLTGAELAKRIKAEYPNIDVIVVSGSLIDDGLAEQILCKPYPVAQTAAELMRRARRKAEGREK